MIHQNYFWDGLEFVVGNHFNTEWADLGGIYIFAKHCYPMYPPWFAVRVGKTKSFRDRLTNHPDWPEAHMTYGATHIHARVVKSAKQRDAVETQLIDSLQPPMNIHHNTS